MIKTALITTGLIFSLFGVSNVLAQPTLDIKTDPYFIDQHRVEQVSPSQTPTINQNRTNQNQATISPRPTTSSGDIQNLQNQVKALENQLGKYNENPKLNDWLSRWWQIGFWVGILWLFPWIFVGWQWARFKFWGFGWPWPWWFWIPLLWFIPWLVIAWQWWLIWWPWWVWVWWIFPWVFWVFWWIILFKEAMIGVWHRRKLSSVTTE